MRNETSTYLAPSHPTWRRQPTRQLAQPAVGQTSDTRVEHPGIVRFAQECVRNGLSAEPHLENAVFPRLDEPIAFLRRVQPVILRTVQGPGPPSTVSAAATRRD